MSNSTSDPNALESEEDGYRAEAIRRLKVRKLFEKLKVKVEKSPKANKKDRKK
jgi:hypothetical protein